MTKRKSRGLGRGLGALIPTEETDATTPSAANGLRTVNVTDIVPNPHQPRTEFDPVQLSELADSIKEHGLIQPLIVTEQTPNQFTLIAGERRWRASQLAELTEVPVVIKESTPQEMLELAIIENVQRADLNPLEEALAYRQLMDQFNLTQSDVAKRMGKARSTVANLVRLLDLPQQIQKAVIDGQISGRHGREMLRLENENDQLAVLKRTVDLDLNVRETTKLIEVCLSNLPDELKAALFDGQVSNDHIVEIMRLEHEDDQVFVLKSAIALNMTLSQTAARVDSILNRQKSTGKQTRTLSPDLVALQDSFRSRLSTRVDIQKGTKGGKVVIHYGNDEDLNSIYDTIIGPEQ